MVGGVLFQVYGKVTDEDRAALEEFAEHLKSRAASFITPEQAEKQAAARERNRERLGRLTADQEPDSVTFDWRPDPLMRGVVSPYPPRTDSEEPGGLK